MTDLVRYEPPAQLATTDVTVAIRQTLMSADNIRQELVAAGDWQSLVCAIADLKKVKFDIDTILRLAEEDAASLLPDKKVVMDGIGVIEKRTSVTRKWESENLLKHIARTTLDPDGTGEISFDRVIVLLEVLNAVLPITASLGWRVTALKNIGIDVNNFSDMTVGRSSITITTNKDERIQS